MLAIAKTIRSACLVLACAGATGCRQAEPAEEQPSAPNSAAPAAANPATSVPLPQPPMDRAALLQAVAGARSAAAAGLDDRQSQQPLDGKAFELRIRFGCDGPDSSGQASPLGWSLDRDAGVLRVHAAPDISKDDPVVATLDLQAVEAVEGLWLPRPWLQQATCPAPPREEPVAGAKTKAIRGAGPALETAAAQQTVVAAPKTGIAQFFTASDSRTARRGGRPYEAVKKLDDVNAVGRRGFDLVLSGRLRALDRGRVIRCVVRSPDAAPACVVSATFDHVWIEDSASKQRIADWSSG